MVDYARLSVTAKRLIDKNGRDLKLLKISDASKDSSKPWDGPVDIHNDTTDPILDEESIDLKGVFVPPGEASKFLGEATDTENFLLFSEQVVMVAPGEVDLREYSVVIDRDDRWGIEGIQVLRPADVTLLAFLGVKR